jgi:hypothetical protein
VKFDLESSYDGFKEPRNVSIPKPLGVVKVDVACQSIVNHPPFETKKKKNETRIKLDKNLVKELQFVFEDRNHTKIQRTGKKLCKKTKHKDLGINPEDVAWLGKGNIRLLHSNQQPLQDLKPLFSREEIPVTEPPTNEPPVNPLLRNAEKLLRRVEKSEKLISERLENMSFTSQSNISTPVPTIQPLMRSVVPVSPKTDVIQLPEADRARKTPDGLLSSLTSEWVEQLLRTELELC